MNSNSNTISVVHEMAKSFDNTKCTPISVVICENVGTPNEKILFSSAIFASPEKFDIPVYLREQVESAPSEFVAKRMAMDTCSISW